MKKISIIVPVYNTENEIERCLKSLVIQKVNNIEIVVVNDGSTDNSEKIIKKYEKEYSEIIKYYKKENTGVADTRNYGIEKATGKYIMFVDSDDYIGNGLLNELEKYIEEDIELIKFKITKVNSNGKEIEKIQGPIFESMSGEEGFNKLYSEDTILDSPCVYLIKKEIFTRNNLKFKVNTYHEDFGLIPLVILYAKTMVSIENYEYYYVQVENSITRNSNYEKTKKKAYDVLEHYDNLIEQVKKMNLNKITKENVKIYYTNAILLKISELKRQDQKKYIREIKKRKMIKNIKIRNIKQLLKRILLLINIKLYLKIR